MTYKRRKRIEAITYDDIAQHEKAEDLFLRDYAITLLVDDRYLLTSRIPSTMGQTIHLSRDEVLIMHSPWHLSTMPKNIFDALFEIDF